MTLYKKGDPSTTNKYGGFSLLSLPRKVFAIWPEKTLHNWADGTLIKIETVSRSLIAKKDTALCRAQANTPVRVTHRCAQGVKTQVTFKARFQRATMVVCP